MMVCCLKNALVFHHINFPQLLTNSWLTTQKNNLKSNIDRAKQLYASQRIDINYHQLLIFVTNAQALGKCAGSTLIAQAAI